jgi:hypothetical protein
MASSSSNGAPMTITHEGIANVTINQDSVNQLVDGAQAIELRRLASMKGQALRQLRQ